MLIIISSVLLIQIIVLYFMFKIIRRQDQINFILQAKEHDINERSKMFSLEYLNKLIDDVLLNNNDSKQAFETLCEKIKFVYNYEYLLYEELITTTISKKVLYQEDLDRCFVILKMIENVNEISIETCINVKLLHLLFSEYYYDPRIIDECIELLEINKNPQFTSQFQHYDLKSKVLNRKLACIHKRDIMKILF